MRPIPSAARRELVFQRCRNEGVRVVFIESICEDERVIEGNVRETKLRSPDYAGVDPEEAVRDFRQRIEILREHLPADFGRSAELHQVD